MSEYQSSDSYHNNDNYSSYTDNAKSYDIWSSGNYYARSSGNAPLWPYIWSP